jgi:Zn-finger nucleic acid-binding protein
MKCPVCTTTTLEPTQLEPTLLGQACRQCGGTWIASNQYWAWLDEQRLAPPELPAPGEPPAVDDVSRAKRCPGCGYLQLGYRIELDLPFQLDQCGHCNSFWLDRNEWAALRHRQLHGKLHRVSGEPWQRALRQEEHRRFMRSFYTAKLGAADYAEAQRVRAWLDQHPERAMLLAYLSNEDPYRV